MQLIDKLVDQCFHHQQLKQQNSKIGKVSQAPVLSECTWEPEQAPTSKHGGEEGIQDTLACQQRRVCQQLLCDRPWRPHRPHLQHGVLLQRQWSP